MKQITLIIFGIIGLVGLIVFLLLIKQSKDNVYNGMISLT